MKDHFANRTVKGKIMMSIIIMALAGIGLPAFCTEVDSFTLRFPPMKDATARVDQMTRELFLKAIDKANESGACEKAPLYRAIREKLGGGPLWSALEGLLTTDPFIDRRDVSRRDSIYGDLSFFNSWPIFLANLAGILQIGDHVVGTDKFGHFFEDGWLQFERAFVEGGGLLEGLRVGEGLENGMEGLSTTGMYSYADLVANFKGMLFFKRLTVHYLEEGETPYVLCRQNKWVLHQLPSWRELVDEGMDEAVNCNRFSGETFTRKIKNRIVQLEERNHRSYQCPIIPRLCTQLRSKYEKAYPLFYDRLISPECLHSTL